MKGLRLNFAVKSALVVSLVIFLIIFGITFLVLNYFYGMVERYTENMLKVINKEFKNDYYDWLKESIYSYGDEIIRGRIDEYGFFKDVVEVDLLRLAIDYDIHNIISNEYIATSFYWDGSRIYSEDKNLVENKEFLVFLREMNNAKVGERRIFISHGRSDVVILVKLNKGILGGRVHPEVYNKVWLEGVFKGVDISYFSSINIGDEKGVFNTVIKEFEHVMDVEKVYNELWKKVSINAFKEKGIEVFGSIHGNSIVFLLVQDYGDFVKKDILMVPLRGIFPMGVWELSMLISLPIVVLVFVLMIMMYNRVFRRIGDLSRKMGEIGRVGGDLTFRIESALDIREVKEVVDNFNEFLDAIEEIVRVSKDTFRDVEMNLGVLSEVGDEVEKVKGVIEKQDEVKQMIEEISAMVGEVSTTIEEMMRSVEVVRGNVEKQYSMIEEMSGMIEEVIMTVGSIGKRVGKADELLGGLREEAIKSSGEVRKNVEEVRDVNMFLGNVLEVVDVIKAIADRIEVLSMNAGIEAAHAGEAGRGFAVVAEEMGNLAEDSRKKAEEVEKMVKEVIGRVKESIEGVENNGEKFLRIAEGIKEISTFVGEINASMVEVGKTNQVVMGVVSNLMGYSEGIRIAMEESRSGMEEVVKAVYEVNEATSNLNDRFGEVYGVLVGIVDVLVSVSEKLPVIVDSLRKLGEELGKFKVREVKFSKGITLVE